MPLPARPGRRAPAQVWERGLRRFNRVATAQRKQETWRKNHPKEWEQLVEAATLRRAPAIHTAHAAKLHKKAVAHEQRAQKHVEGGNEHKAAGHMLKVLKFRAAKKAHLEVAEGTYSSVAKKSGCLRAASAA